ncbi:glycosyltransferase family 4 protein [Methanohalophilus sp. DAL1]|uniref:glycosyltransferase family 4 protein n=1 Tax=Methanohalophilus sp. DAL1 TaxID=1864608 RepID=UPI00081830C0|nr:glycosyltransferase family 4 protein [Methanohalophilus sp. DAL1]OBZ34826.1 MAG: glycosyltransferase WbuB [Methanohalophilus sp. DAL1]
MKILVVQESDWIERGPHNSHHIMERLSIRGHEIRVIDYEILWKESNNEKGLVSKRKTFHDQHKSIDNGNITVIRPSIVKLPALNYLSLVHTHHKEIEKQIDSFKPDVIVGLGIVNTNIAIRLAKKNNIPFVYYVMDVLHRLVPQNYFQPLAAHIERKNMENADRVISVTEGLREYTISMGADRDKTEVIRTGIDFDHFKIDTDGKEIREKYGIKDDDIVLFFMGWLYTFSGLKELVSEVINLPKTSKIKLFILGKGELWDFLQNLKSYDNFNKITIVGWQPYADVPKYLAAADICLLPAYNNDTMKYIVPIKIYEYMTMGKPVIATDLYGMVKEFGYNSGVTYTDKPEEILKLAQHLIENDQLISEGKKAQGFVANNCWDNISEEFERYLESIS